MRKQSYKSIQVDVLIIGAGAAGIRTAIELKQKGVGCLLIGKRKHGDAHTIWAAGGINASLGSLDQEDRWDIHAADTFREGHFINCPRAVEMICKDAPERIRELQAWGCDFNMTDDGKIDQRYFGAQSFRRTCFVGDRTGEAMLATLVNKAKELGIPYMEDIYVCKILTDHNITRGALAFDLNTGQHLAFICKAVVLAAGGYSGIFERHSSRKNENTADGPALGLEAGACLKDMEMVQFHPTGMLYPEEFEGRLVTEAARGEGGRLFNGRKERFMEKYSPEHMELDARDVVARSIYLEIQDGRGTEKGGVYLDLSHKEEKLIQERLPAIYKRFKELGIDIAKEPVEIAPTAHYTMGGVDVDFSNGATSVEGLFAVGETAAGMHGANRLGGNSLLETVVLGKVCGEHLTEFVKNKHPNPPPPKIIKDLILELSELKNKNGRFNPLDLIREVRKTMWKSAGIIREAEIIEGGIRKIDAIANKTNDLRTSQSEKGATLENALDLKFMLTIARAVLQSALMRQESRGAHYRSDFPKTDRNWQKNILCKRNSTGNTEYFTRDVPAISNTLKNALEEQHALNYHHLE